MIMILGYIFAAILSVIAVWMAYHIVRGLVIGIDLMRWKLACVTFKEMKKVLSYKMKLFKMFLECWSECVGYDGAPTYSSDGKRWSGYGTGREETLDNQ